MRHFLWDSACCLWRCRKRKRELLSHVWLCATPWTAAHQAPLSMGFSRQECWSGLSFPPPGDLPNPETEAGSPDLQADSLPAEPPAKPERWNHLRSQGLSWWDWCQLLWQRRPRILASYRSKSQLTSHFNDSSAPGVPAWVDCFHVVSDRSSILAKLVLCHLQHLPPKVLLFSFVASSLLVFLCLLLERHPAETPKTHARLPPMGGFHRVHPSPGRDVTTQDTSNPWEQVGCVVKVRWSSQCGITEYAISEQRLWKWTY